MGLKRPTVFGLVAIGVLGACNDADRGEAARTPDAGRPSSPSTDLDASMPDRELDASIPDRELDAAADAADASEGAQETTCQALSNACPFLRCEDPASTLSEASSQCGSPPFIRSAMQGSACGRTIVAYRYGASDTTIVFFDVGTGELTGWWNQSDTGQIGCSGQVDLACAISVEMSLPHTATCLPDAGATGAADAGGADSGL